MEELFILIGKLYFDLIRSQAVIEDLKKQLNIAIPQQSFNSDNLEK